MTRVADYYDIWTPEMLDRQAQLTAEAEYQIENCKCGGSVKEPWDYCDDCKDALVMLESYNSEYYDALETIEADESFTYALTEAESRMEEMR